MARAAINAAVALVCAGIGTGAVMGTGTGTALAEPLRIGWHDLRDGRPGECAAFLERYLGEPDCAGQVLMSRVLAGRIAACSPGNPALAGQTVRIAGYVHPLDFAFRDVRSFLLIPPLRPDCRHPPAPLPDQVIAVEFPAGVDVTADPVWVTGVLRLEPSRTPLAPAGYAMEAQSITAARIPEVAGAE